MSAEPSPIWPAGRNADPVVPSMARPADAVVQRLIAQVRQLEDLEAGIAQSLRNVRAEIQGLRNVLGDYAPSATIGHKPHARTARRAQVIVRMLRTQGPSRMRDLHRWCTEIMGEHEAGSYQTFRATIKSRPDLFVRQPGREGIWSLREHLKPGDFPNERDAGTDRTRPEEPDRPVRGSIR